MNTSRNHDRAPLGNHDAFANRKQFDANRTTAFTIVGPAGSGKTSIIEQLMMRLAPPLKAAVVMCNLAADRQISRITRHGYPAVALKEDNISASRIRHALSQLSLAGLDLLFIE